MKKTGKQESSKGISTSKRNTVNFQFKEVRFKEFFLFKQEFYFPKMKK